MTLHGRAGIPARHDAGQECPAYPIGGGVARMNRGHECRTIGEVPIAKKKDEARELAKLCARIADDKKGEHILVLGMTRLIVLTDYFVITHGTNRRQVQAVADAIAETMHKLRVPCLSREGMEDTGWVLLDYGEVVVHVFDEATRAFYDLEHLWGDAPRVRWRRTPRVRKGETS